MNKSNKKRNRPKISTRLMDWSDLSLFLSSSLPLSCEHFFHTLSLLALSQDRSRQPAVLAAVTTGGHRGILSSLMQKPLILLSVVHQSGQLFLLKLYYLFSLFWSHHHQVAQLCVRLGLSLLFFLYLRIEILNTCIWLAQLFIFYKLSWILVTQLLHCLESWVV